MKPKRAYKHFCEGNSTQISWKAIQEHIKTRSIDDLRNFWALKIMPVLGSFGGKKKSGSVTQWTEQMDINLLESIVDQEVSD